jgi:Sodium/hydrogen exchanger family
MRKVYLYSLLLASGLIASQFLAGRGQTPIKLLMMFCLSFIMIRVGYGFEISKERAPNYIWDQVVAMTTTIFPWLFCAAYFVFAMAPEELRWSRDMWWEALLAGRFAAPTSVGVLFPMLAAAGLTGTWLYKKARTLAIFDDLDTLLLLVPLKFMLVSMNLTLTILVLLPLGLSWAAWRYLYVAQRPVNLPANWPWVMFYSATITLVMEGINIGSQAIDQNVPVHLEVLLPAFILGSLMARSPQTDFRADHTGTSQKQGLDNPQEQQITTLMSACFMALVGLSLPPLLGLTQARTDAGTIAPLKFEGVPPDVLARLQHFPGWGIIAIHVMIVSALSNLGKMAPAFCYGREASRRERLALSIGMWPRGEVGAGVLVISLSHGISDTVLTVAVLSLALNLLCSGIFVLAVKKLIAPAA